ncbi:MAG TPA: GNAT family N-acetyltransferase [Burkholderiaceae bacterium]
MRLIARMDELGREAWNGLLAGDRDATPFLAYDFLHALHESRCAAPGTGWAPRMLCAWHGPDASGRERLAGAVPLYLKSHSYGEYVFDWSWADAHARQGLAYYPKWLAAVPFTPVPGSRLIAADDESRQALAAALAGTAQESGLSSLHVLLLPPAQARTLAEHGLLVRRGVQFHWRNAGYADFEEFLGALTQVKRKKIRAERRKVAQAGVRLERLVGGEITESDWRFFDRCYRNTYAEHGSTPYLNLPFFLALARSMPEQLLLVKALRGTRPVASALAIFDPDTRRSALYGRYWGALERIDCLHFECCYYQMIEFAIEHGLAVFEGGAQGAHKLARGLDPVETCSAHWIADPKLRAAIARSVQREAQDVAQAIDELNEHRALRED